MHRTLAFGLAWLLTLVSGLVPAADIPTLTARITDQTGTLDAAAVARIDAPLAALEARKGSQIAVLIVPTTAPESIEAYAVRAFEQWKLGRAGVDDGVLLVVAKEDRTVRIEVGYGLEGAIPDVSAYRVIQEYLVPHFRDGDFAGGIEAAVGALSQLVDGEALPEPMSSANPYDATAGQSGSDVPFDHHADDDLISLLPFVAVALVIARVFLDALTKSWWRRGLAGGTTVAIVAGFLFGWSLLVLGVGFVAGFLFSVAKLEGGGGGGYARSGSYSSSRSSSSSGSSSWSGGGGRSGGGGASGRW